MSGPAGMSGPTQVDFLLPTGNSATIPADNPYMTAPRQVLPAVTYLVTRRCSERRFFLRPSELVNQVFSYCLAYAANRHGILLHAWTCLSNHYHAVVSDPKANLPLFMADLNRLVSKCVNASLGRWESLWSSERYSAVSLTNESAVWEKLIYVLANPVQGGLVNTWQEWPGVTSGPRAVTAKPRTIRRPDLFFRGDGTMPEKVTLWATLPPCFSGDKAGRFATRLGRALDSHEAEILAAHRAENRSVLGRDAVLRENPEKRPKSFEPRRGVNPQIAGRDRWLRTEALRRLRSFLDSYREAWKKFREGIRDVLFPAGTYWMCRHAGCEAVPLD